MGLQKEIYYFKLYAEQVKNKLEFRVLEDWCKEKSIVLNELKTFQIRCETVYCIEYHLQLQY